LGASGTFFFLYDQSASLSWGVELGTEITYAVRVTGFTDYWHNGSVYPAPYAALNDTLLTIRIDSLPEIGAFLNSVTFAESILEHVKTMIVEPIEYVNGSEVAPGNYSFLNNLVSQSILPVGNWPFIDSLYSDKPDMEYSCDTYLASLGTSFMIGHKVFVIDAGNGWYATVDMITGLPTNTTVWASQYNADPWYSYEIMLTPLLSD